MRTEGFAPADAGPSGDSGEAASSQQKPVQEHEKPVQEREMPVQEQEQEQQTCACARCVILLQENHFYVKDAIF